MPSPPQAPAQEDGPGSLRGVALAISCYVVWGLVPIYWKAPALDAIPAFEALIPRVLWTAILLLGVAALTGRWGEIRPGNPREWRPTLAAATVLAFNWTVFVYAVQTDRIIATSLGYYINPLMSVLLGLLILGERINRAQTTAIAIAAIGVAWMTLRAGELPWISLALASSFAVYGVLHKLHPGPPIGGLIREMLVLAPLALVALAGLATADESALLRSEVPVHAYLSLTGVLTAIPLLLFHAATRRLPLVAVGMFQYIAPTITLGIATALYAEPFSTNDALGFGCVWIGLIVFTFDSVRRSREARQLLRPADVKG